MDATASIQEQVSQYYGRIPQTTKDLETGACRNTDALPSYQREALALIHPEILERAYGCGSPIPPAIDGCTILDLGCGAGRDAYLAGRLVGPTGSVIGVDMTDEPLAVARRHVDSQMARFGHARPNVEFRQGLIEDLAACGISPAIDPCISVRSTAGLPQPGCRPMRRRAAGRAADRLPEQARSTEGADRSRGLPITHPGRPRLSAESRDAPRSPFNMMKHGR